MNWSWLWLLGGGLAGAALRGGQTTVTPTAEPAAPAEETTRREAEEASRRERDELSRREADERERRLNELERQLGAEKLRLQMLGRELEQAQRGREDRLAELAGLSREQALERLRTELLQKEHTYLQQVADTEWNRLAAQKICTAMGRVVVREVSEQTLSSLTLPSDEMKGRIIGKEGRNLRLFESLTGVDVLIDDTPQIVTLSCFDSLRREVARVALESLVAGGRISAGRIEEAVVRARQQLEAVVEEKGREAATQAEVRGLHPELITALGRLAFRSSYRQNVLDHSIEVAWLCAHLAAELRVDVEVSRRAGLLHDIGKGIQGRTLPHAVAGAELCRRFGESAAVSHAVEAHHEDVPQTSVEDVLITVSDAISAARPGARRENSQAYLERLQRLEQLGLARAGVAECHVVQAGREVRVFVRPSMVDDEGCQSIAQSIAQDIESALPLPGPVKVTVIRNFEAVQRTR